jgi:hypothetical protein
MLGILRALEQSSIRLYEYAAVDALCGFSVVVVVDSSSSSPELSKLSVW